MHHFEGKTHENHKVCANIRIDDFGHSCPANRLCLGPGFSFRRCFRCYCPPF
ncbi:hypothetical protein HMPREF0972_00278 [Actinomyces sp. oral taxon 848 str. F0332]|nr:hypothetical protein HMPREF0972_00278 [Actinomyces sp. oral taxon 848 str. F0332]